MLDFLPKSLKDALLYVNGDCLYELRIRKDCPIKVNYGGEWRYLSPKGITRIKEQAISFCQKDIETLVFAAGNYSLYSYEDEMRECFLTSRSGERIGIAATVVTEKGKILSLRDVTSVCIRVPHDIQNCADVIFSVFENGFYNILLLSPPGYGKTTILRALAKKISATFTINILVIDERGELYLENSALEADVIRFMPKKEAIPLGIRSLRPDLIITDEVQEDEWNAVKKAKDCGINVIASCHCGEDVTGIPRNIFDRFVLLGNKEGQVLSIYDGEKNKL